MLPKDYKVPVTGGNYMRLEPGENQFRVLDSAVVGWEAWTMDRKPVRFKMEDKPDDTSEYKDGRLKHFWAFPVWNYKANSIQVLELTQSTIQQAIEGFINDPDWGDPKDYDIKVERTGEGLDTSYFIAPKPKKPLTDEVWALYKDNKPNLEALFTGDDPFAKKGVVEEESIDPNDIPF